MKKLLIGSLAVMVTVFSLQAMEGGEEYEKIQKTIRMARAEEYAKKPLPQLLINLTVDNRTGKRIAITPGLQLGYSYGTVDPGKSDLVIKLDYDFFKVTESPHFMLWDATVGGPSLGAFGLYAKVPGIVKAIFIDGKDDSKVISESSIEIPHTGDIVRFQVNLTLDGKDLEDSEIEIEGALVADKEKLDK